MIGKIKIGLVMVILITCFACQKKDAPTPVPSNQANGCALQTYHIDSDLSKLKFKQNSYWVYIDSVSLTIDSTYFDVILNSGISSVSSGRCIADIEFYEYRIKKSLPPFYDTISLSAMHSYASRNTIFYYGGNANPIYWEYSQATNHSCISTGDTLFKKDSMFIYDRYYKQVTLISCAVDENENNLKSIYYANSDYGLLRKDVFNPNGTLKNKLLLKNKNVVR